MSTYSAVLLLAFFTFVSGAADIPCSQITVENNVNLTELEGKWIIQEMYDEESLENMTSIVCSYLLITNTNSEINITVTTIEKPTDFKFSKDFSYDIEQHGKWILRGQGSTKQQAMLLTTSPSGYYSMAMCRENTATNTMKVTEVMSLKRKDTHPTENDIEILRNNVKAALGAQLLRPVQFDTDC